MWEQVNNLVKAIRCKWRLAILLAPTHPMRRAVTMLALGGALQKIEPDDNEEVRATKEAHNRETLASIGYWKWRNEIEHLQA